MRVSLRRLAKLDLLEARSWYDEHRPGLGDEFREEVEAVLQRIAVYPRIAPRLDERVRRAALSRFPYGIFYVIEADAIRVIAVLHGARSPEHWRRRR